MAQGKPDKRFYDTVMQVAALAAANEQPKAGTQERTVQKPPEDQEEKVAPPTVSGMQSRVVEKFEKARLPVDKKEFDEDVKRLGLRVGLQLSRHAK
ncbi:hypothetical protein DL766_007032 [Monosporascus sp. MC13-8B]|uniref:Uncharacterized protein n=1 Tax=Monosporascus cannonballus TaxID=155416 RepID=A0ABY0H8B2_9PEZI|nr:hypothetical protein DL763_008033 [Monosporascus cannonballus]RYO84091.1 hypothetical protein DL762_005837 [Monosporascus cannonballus]RYP25482.1 hypothetical protein DL766_007032 [Monosporascus sp. MC13-8B]